MNISRAVVLKSGGLAALVTALSVKQADAQDVYCCGPGDYFGYEPGPGGRRYLKRKPHASFKRQKISGKRRIAGEAGNAILIFPQQNDGKGSAAPQQATLDTTEGGGWGDRSDYVALIPLTSGFGKLQFKPVGGRREKGQNEAPPPGGPNIDLYVYVRSQ